MARILLGVSGGIAAYKAVELARLAIKAGHVVRVVQTPDSVRFVGKATFEGITGAPVLTDQFEHDPAAGAFPDQPRPSHDPISHLALVENCDVLVVAPATANTIAKLAQGMADNMLTALALGCRRPIVVAPAMNNEMYLSPATTENLAVLRDRGVVVVEPDTGELASKGEYGIGRLPEPPALLDAIEDALAAGGAPNPPPRPLTGRNVLVTAGGTREPIDAVRFVGNRSSGKMGFAVAEAAAARGADVTVIAANVALARSPRIRYVDVETAAQLEAAARERFSACDVLVMAAAVADFRPAQAEQGKIKKAGREGLQIDLEPTADVLAALSELRRPGQILVGFAAETGANMLDEAQRKLDNKRLDMVVANDVSDPAIGFESDDNAVTLVTADGRTPVARAAKAEIAAAIVDACERLVEAGSTPTRAGNSP
jgi:phosphopantothenoylcysteine decarboxylase/phosphopantothenate--cysteine ligase